MLERMSLFVLGGVGTWVELAWRGTTHWTMFLAGGLCLCLLQRLATRRMSLPAAAGVGCVGVSGLEAVYGRLCRGFLHVAYGTTVPSGAIWRG